MPGLRILYVSACAPVINGTGSQKRSHVAVTALREIGDVYYLEAPPSAGAPHAQGGESMRHFFAAHVSATQLLEGDTDAWGSFLRPGQFAAFLKRAWITAGAMLPLTARQRAASLACISRAFGKEPFDVIYIFQAHSGLFMAGLLPALSQPGTTSVIDWDAAERPAALDQYRARENPGIRTKISATLNDLKLARYERQLLDLASLTVCASDLDVDYFRSRRPRSEVLAIPNCVDIPAQALAPTIADDPTVLFVGLINYWPNRSGLLQFLESIWPQVRVRHPTARFNIVGRGLTDDVRAWQGRDGVHVIGEVEAVEPWYASCHVAIAPMFFSVGSSIKILEALAFNRALVAFETSTRRHALVDGEHVAVARNNAHFAQLLNGLLDDPEAAAAMALRGRRQVKEKYSRVSMTEATRQAIASHRLPWGLSKGSSGRCA